MVLGAIRDRSRTATVQANSPMQEKRPKTSSVKWRTIAIIASLLALLLAVGLSILLGLFFAKTECGPPPKHDLASTTYLGSAVSGSKVTYVCPRPYVFPNGNQTFFVTCTQDLEWDVFSIPPCSRQPAKRCSGLLHSDSFDLSLSIEDKIESLEVELRFSGQMARSFNVDLRSDDDSLCSIDDRFQVQSLENRSASRWASTPLALKDRFFKQDEKAINNYLKITDSVIDPGMPYEIRLRGAGDLLAVSLVQNEYLNITLTSFSGLTKQAYDHSFLS